MSCVLSLCCCLAGALCALPALVLSILASRSQPETPDSSRAHDAEAVQIVDVGPPNAQLNNLDENTETTSGRQGFGRSEPLLLVNVIPRGDSTSGYSGGDRCHTRLSVSSSRYGDDNLQMSSPDVELVNTNVPGVKDCAHNQRSLREESGNNGSVLFSASRTQINQSHDRNSIIIEQIRPRTLSRKLYSAKVKLFIHVKYEFTEKLILEFCL